jgi:flagellar basal-body rod protein FlgC
MKLLGCLLGLLISISAFASTSKECQELKSEQIRLSLIGSNLANINSTRTPEGGPYRPYIVKSCANGGCDAKQEDRAPILKYLPGHPDANENGYVAFPNIDIKREYAAFNMTALKLKLLAVKSTCGAKVTIDNGSSSFALHYKSMGSDVKEDIFNLNSQHQVVSWMREDFKGVATTSNFPETSTTR